MTSHVRHSERRSVISDCLVYHIWGAQESAMCACGHIIQQHVVVDCMIHKAPGGFAGLRLGWKNYELIFE